MPSNVEYASTEAKIRRLPVKYVDVSTEFPVSVSADSVLMVSKAMKLDPDVLPTRPLTLPRT